MVPFFLKKESTMVILQKPLLIPIIANSFCRITVIDAHICQYLPTVGCQYLPTVLTKKPLLIRLILPTVI
jgi:hypothetical protein